MNATAIAIIVIIAILFIGNFMGAKPKLKELQLDMVRTVARRLELNPKLIPIPDFLSQKKPIENSNKAYYDYSKTDTPILIQYSLINDDWQLPKGVFLINNNQLNLLPQEIKETPKTYLERQAIKLSDNAKKLDKFLIDDKLNNLLPFLKGVLIQANSISIYFDDEQFAKTLKKLIQTYQGNHQFNNDEQLLNHIIQSELLALKTAMATWVKTVQS